MLLASFMDTSFVAVLVLFLFQVRIALQQRIAELEPVSELFKVSKVSILSVL